MGTAVELRVTLTDPDTNLPIDPTSIVCQIKAPSGTMKATLSGPTKESNGRYRWVVVPDEPGVWAWRVLGSGLYPAEGVGPVPVAEEGRFFVKKSLVV